MPVSKVVAEPTVTVPAVEKIGRSRRLNGFKAKPISKATSAAKSTLPEEKQLFKCRFCPVVFTESQMLGGHTSRAHPGQSPDYRKKKETRLRREPLRLARAEAKKQLAETHGEIALNDGQYRRQMRALQKELLPAFLTAQASVSDQ